MVTQPDTILHLDRLEGRPLRNNPVDYFRGEPACRGGERKRKNLIRLGVDLDHAYQWSRSRKGGWAILILQGLCNNQDIVDTFHVSTDSVRRWKKKLSEEGDGAFFKEESRHGRSHKLLPTVLDRIQGKLDQGRSSCSIASQTNFLIGQEI